jgi:hypothetical protein
VGREAQIYQSLAVGNSSFGKRLGKVTVILKAVNQPNNIIAQPDSL